MALRKALWVALILFISFNVVAFIHAYKFTHFASKAAERTKDPKELSAFAKVSLLVTGIDNPRPKHTSIPSQLFETIHIKGTETLECWSIKAAEAQGTVILFHGYSGEKSSLLTRSNEFHKLGYNTFLVDFRGSGGSTGNGTTIGYKEAGEVNACYEFIREAGEENIILFGTSMGAAAVLKAINDYAIVPSAIILECPFGSLYRTVCARFMLMNLPSFPMAAILTFWGGVQNGYWAFSHNPSEYAKAVDCPALLLFGEEDDRVTIEETDLIFGNLKGEKVLKTYTNAGHNFFTEEMLDVWLEDVGEFLQSEKVKVQN
jgi:pimeloyl-ACP methyl ester carboxylesterase